MSLAYRSYLATLLMLFCMEHVSGQRSGFGLKAGPQLNTFKATNTRTTLVPGLSLGAYAPIGLAARFELQPELLFAMMGTGIVEADGDRYTLRTVYAQAPITAKYFLNNTMNMQGGVQFGYLLVAQRTDVNGNSNVGDQFRPIDLGFNIGLGLDSHNGVDLTLRYYSGMPALLKNDEKMFPRNRSLQLTLGKRVVQVRKMAPGRRRK